jgi:tetratricopeptide (TPR) repeat protein
MTPPEAETPNRPFAGDAVVWRLGTYFQRQWIRIALLFFVGLAVRAPALQGQLIWDDQYLVRSNPFIRSPLLAVETFRHYLFPDSVSTHYRPVQNLSYSVDYLLWSNNPYGFHLSNVLWHVAAGILLFLLLQRLLTPLLARAAAQDSAENAETRSRTRSSIAAFIIALLWLVHPVHSAAIDYISGRADSLACFFARSVGGWPLRYFCYGSAAVSSLLALCSRESAAIWMLIFVVHLLAVSRDVSRRAKFVVLAACVMIVAAYAGLRQLPATSNVLPAASSSSAPVRATLMLRALGDYGRLLVFPTKLHMDRSLEADEAHLGNAGWRLGIRAEYLSIAGLFFAGVLLYGATRKGPTRPIRAFGAAWFVVAFLPISNLIPLNASVAEHWLYLPSIGFLLFVAGCCMEVPARRRKLVYAAACIAVLGLGARSYVRSADWVSEETLYRSAIRTGAAKIRVALNLGQFYTAKGDYAKAEPLLRKVVTMSPDYPLARSSLAHCLMRQGKEAEAEEFFTSAKKMGEHAPHEHPRTWVAALNLAQMHRNRGDLPAALAVLGEAHRDHPRTWALIVYHAELLREAEGPEAALPLVQEFARENWWHAGAALALGRIYAHQGNVPAAEAALRHASRLDVHDAEALNLLTRIRLNQHRFADAYESQRRAVRRQPDQPRQHLLLSDVLDRMGRGEEARAMLAKVTQMQTMAQAVAD